MKNYENALNRITEGLKIYNEKNPDHKLYTQKKIYNTARRRIKRFPIYK